MLGHPFSNAARPVSEIISHPWRVRDSNFLQYLPIDSTDALVTCSATR